MTIDTLELQKHSVTRDDTSAGYPLTFLVAPLGPQHITPGLPAWHSKQRDAVLTATLDLEDMWQSAVYKTITKRTARGWEVKDTEDSTVRVRRYQQMLLRFDGTRYVPGMSKVLQDFLLTDNGAFVEVVRVSKASGSRILGLMHLDSFRCTRTGDPAIPVIYRDGKGSEHELRDYQIIDFVDQPSPRSSANGVGRCAATRAFRTVITLSSIQIYFREKVTGDRNLAIHIVNGISPDQITDALTTASEDRKRKGYVMYKGSVVIPAIKADAPLSVVTIPLAEIPDGFDVDLERKDAYLRYANALGVPVQDIQPLSGQGLGTGTQTIILSEEAEGLGLAAFDRDFTHALNDFVFPETTTFVWTNPHDTRDQKAKAEVDKLRVDTAKAMRGDQNAPGPITPEQELNLLVDWNVVPREFLPADGDQTPGGALSDEEKPVVADVVAPIALPVPAAAVVNPPPAVKELVESPRWTPMLTAAVKARMITEEQADREMGNPIAKKATSDDLIDSEWEQAMEWAKKVME